jgi:methionine sulfoxide reductase catalytic subunit
MLIRKPRDISYSEVTPHSLYLTRRSVLLGLPAAFPGNRARAGTGLANVVKSPFSTSEKVNSVKDVTTYNNFYEFGTSKKSPPNSRRISGQTPGFCLSRVKWLSLASSPSKKS